MSASSPVPGPVTAAGPAHATATMKATHRVAIARASEVRACRSLLIKVWKRWGWETRTGTRTGMTGEEDIVGGPHATMTTRTAIGIVSLGRDGPGTPEISDEKKQRKKLNRQALMTAGLATIATVHAAHGLHQNMEKRKQRMQMVKDGAISPEEARRLRIKANLADAASIGLSALSIKGAVAEWKEADEKRRERAEFRKKCEQRRQKRQERMRSKSQSAAGSPRFSWRTVDPDKIEENASSSGYLHSHAGKVRSPSVGADMRYRSSYWS